MAHNIDTTTGTAAVFTVGTPAWHGLGVNIENAVDSAEAIKLAGLDWEIQQLPVFATTPDGEQIAIPDRVANVRMDTKTSLAVVSHSYRVFQNAECFDFMDSVVGESLAMYHTAGSLGRGNRVWMLAKIPREYRIAGDDVVEPYALLTNAHDGTAGLKVMATTVRVVCQNTLNLALSEARNAMSLHHRPNLESRVDDARKALGVVTNRLDKFSVEAKALAARKLTTAEANNYFKALFPTQVAPTKSQNLQAESFADLLAGNVSSSIDESKATLAGDAVATNYFAKNEREAERNREIFGELLGNFDNERNKMAGIEHTAWAAYNAVSEYADHGQNFRGATVDDKRNARLNSIWFGKANTIKQEAFSNALQLIG